MARTIDDPGWFFALFALHLIVPDPSVLHVLRILGRPLDAALGIAFSGAGTVLLRLD